MTPPRCTEDAIALGGSIADDLSAVALCKQLHRHFDAIARDCIAAKKLSLAMLYATSAQLWRETHEAATMTGGVGDVIRRAALSPTLNSQP